MRHDPFHERPWAELLFWLVALPLLGVLGAWQFMDDGDWLWLGSCALSLSGLISMVVVIRRKLSIQRSPSSQDRNG